MDELVMKPGHISRNVYSGDIFGLAGFFWQAETYPIIVADPPWWYADQKKERKDTKTPTRGIGACHHYGQIKTKDLCKLPISMLAEDRCLLFLWATAPLLPDALQVMEAWDFSYSTIAFTWVKLNPKAWAIRKLWQGWASEILNARCPQLGILLNVLTKLAFFGPGYYTGSNVELVLVGKRKRGSSIAHKKGHKPSQLVFAPVGEHSAKPECVQGRIEWMYEGPYLELFARRERKGWDVLGLEV